MCVLAECTLVLLPVTIQPFIPSLLSPLDCQLARNFPETFLLIIKFGIFELLRHSNFKSIVDGI